MSIKENKFLHFFVESEFFILLVLQKNPNHMKSSKMISSQINLLHCNSQSLMSFRNIYVSAELGDINKRKSFIYLFICILLGRWDIYFYNKDKVNKYKCKNIAE